MEISNLMSAMTSHITEYLGGKVNRSMYDIVDNEMDARLKEIHPQIVLLFNKIKNMYEVHHMGYYLKLGAPSSTYLCGWEYVGKPDHRLINHVKETLSRTADEASKIVMEHNKMLDYKREKRFKDNLESAVKDGIKKVSTNPIYVI